MKTLHLQSFRKRVRLRKASEPQLRVIYKAQGSASIPESDDNNKRIFNPVPMGAIRWLKARGGSRETRRLVDATACVRGQVRVFECRELAGWRSVQNDKSGGRERPSLP